MPFKISFFVWLFLGCKLIMAQSISSDVVGNAGTYYTNTSGANLHWTLGETAVQQYVRDEVILSEGFQQSYLDLIITDIWEAPELEFNFSVAPNPTVDHLTLDTDNMDEFDVLISNTLGQTVEQSSFDNGTAYLSLGKYPSGIYWLSIFHNGRLIQSFKILKQK